jgi:hypothetical protein
MNFEGCCLPRRQTFEEMEVDTVKSTNSSIQIRFDVVRTLGGHPAMSDLKAVMRRFSLTLDYRIFCARANYNIGPIPILFFI